MMPVQFRTQSDVKTDKTIYFIRHCESLNNEVHYAFTNILKGSRTLQYDFAKIFSGFSKMSYDCDITKVGESQIVGISTALINDNFWQKAEPEVVVYSPLIRTTKTCQGIMKLAPEPYNKLPVYMNPDLVEARLFEDYIANTLDDRIHAFERYLRNLDAKSIIVVGHGYYLRRMLNYTNSIENCDVICAKAYFPGDLEVYNKKSHMIVNSSSVCIWHDVKLVHHVSSSFYNMKNDVQVQHQQ